MKEIPLSTEPYKKTPTFNQKTVPPGLLKTHKTKEGVWGKICILNGKLLYTIEVEPQETIELSTNKHGVVEPEVPHHLEMIGEVEFFVEFYQ